MIILRLIHIVSGGFWAGAGIFMGWLVGPAAQAAGPGAGPFMQALLKRRTPIILVSTGIVTVASGIWLLAIRQPTMRRWQDWALVIGALSAIIALTIWITLQRPTLGKVQALGAQIAGGGQPPTPAQGAEMGMLQSKIARYGSTIAFLFAVALAGMALGGS